MFNIVVCIVQLMYSIQCFSVLDGWYRVVQTCSKDITQFGSQKLAGIRESFSFKRAQNRALTQKYRIVANFINNSTAIASLILEKNVSLIYTKSPFKEIFYYTDCPEYYQLTCGALNLETFLVLRELQSLQSILLPKRNY